jgi:hypothetical protein
MKTINGKFTQHFHQFGLYRKYTTHKSELLGYKFILNKTLLELPIHLRRVSKIRPAHNTGVDKSPISEPHLNGASPMKLNQGSKAGIKKN